MSRTVPTLHCERRRKGSDEAPGGLESGAASAKLIVISEAQVPKSASGHTSERQSVAAFPGQFFTR